MYSKTFITALAGVTVAASASATLVPNRLIVTVKPGYSADLIAARVGGRIVNRVPELGVVAIQTNSTTIAQGQAVVTRAKTIPGVGFVKLSQKMQLTQATRTPNDPRYREQYGLPAVNMPLVWSRSIGSPNTVVAVLDSGIDLNHEDFAGKLVPGYDFSDNDADPTDMGSHGTHVSGIVGAATDNGKGVAGIGWNVKIMPLKVFPNSFEDVVAKAMVHAASNGARVINMSLGAYYNVSDAVEYGKAVQFATSKNCIVVASAGNGARDHGTYSHIPSDIPGVVCVGSSDAQNNRSDFSDYGDRVDIVAPGSDILSTMPGGNQYANSSGTSMSGPMVAGAMGLAVSYASPNTKAADIVKAFLLSAKKMPVDPRIGRVPHGPQGGFMDVFGAIQRLKTAQTFLITPDDMWFSTPSGTGGNRAKVAAVDGNVISASSVQQNIGAVTVSNIRLNLFKSGYTLTNASLRLTSRVNSSNVTAQYFAMNVNTGQYELLRSLPMTSSASANTVLNLDLGSIPSKYISGGNLALQMRTLRPAFRGPSTPYTFSVDQVLVTGRYSEN